MSDLQAHLDAVRARSNWGRWVVDCATPYCTNAWMVRVGQPHWDCFTCGYRNEINWPPDPAAIEYLLEMRPDPKTRNWEPGETLTDLLMENIAHGVVPPEVADDVHSTVRASISVMTTEDGMVVDGRILPAVLRHRQDLALATYEHLIEIEG